MGHQSNNKNNKLRKDKLTLCCYVACLTLNFLKSAFFSIRENYSMKTESKDIYISLENGKVEDFNQELQTLLFQSSENYSVLMSAFNKYRLAVKQHLDPSISSEESVLLLASLIEKLADSLPSYINDEPRVTVNFFQKTREKIFQFKYFFKQQLVK